MGPPSRIPSFLNGTEHLGEDRLACQYFRDPLDQWPQPRLWHVRDELVEHASLTQQRVGTPLSRVGLEVAIVAERFPGGTQQGQQHDAESADQPQAITPVGCSHVHPAPAHAEAEVLFIANTPPDTPA